MKKETTFPSIAQKATHENLSALKSSRTLSFGAVLQKYRNLNNLSQPELADIMGVSRNTITNWETNKSRPEIEAIRQLCIFLGIPINELLGLSDDLVPSSSENTLLKQYRQLNSSNQRIVAHLISKRKT